MQKHLVRVVSDEEITNYVKSFNQSNIEVLEISGNRWGMLFKADNYYSLSFAEIDVEKSLNGMRQYDLIILEHVLEHISDPKLALKNIYDILKPKGRLIVVTPFLIKIHESPLDCTRWTKEGLNFSYFKLVLKIKT